MLEILARGLDLACPRFENAQIVPAVGVVLKQLERQPLLGNRLFEFAGFAQHL